MSTNTSHNSGITIKSSREIDLMREVGKVVAEAKAAVREAIKPGVSGKELDVLGEEKIRSLGAIHHSKDINHPLCFHRFLQLYVFL